MKTWIISLFTMLFIFCYGTSYSHCMDIKNIQNKQKILTYIENSNYQNIAFYKALEKYKILKLNSWRINPLPPKQIQLIAQGDIDIKKMKLLIKDNVLYKFDKIKVTNAKLHISWIVMDDHSVVLDSFHLTGTFIKDRKDQDYEYSTLCGFGNNNPEYFRNIISDIFNNSAITIGKIMLSWNTMKSVDEQLKEYVD